MLSEGTVADTRLMIPTPRQSRTSQPPHALAPTVRLWLRFRRSARSSTPGPTENVAFCGTAAAARRRTVFGPRIPTSYAAMAPAPTPAYGLTHALAGSPVTLAVSVPGRHAPAPAADHHAGSVGPVAAMCMVISTPVRSLRATGDSYETTNAS